MARPLTWRRLLVPVLMAGVLGACGGGDSGLTREELIAQADARCRRVLDLFPTERGEANESRAETVERYRRQVDFYRRVDADLAGLEPPKELRGDFEQFRTKTRDQARNREDAGAAIGSRDLARFQAVAAEFRAINDTKRELRARLGFRTC